MGNRDGYRHFRDLIGRDGCYIQYALHSYKHEHRSSSVDIIISEMQLVNRNRLELRPGSDTADIIVTENINDPHTAMQDPVLFQYCVDRGLLDISDFLHELIIRRKNGAKGCQSLIEAGCFTEDELKRYLRNQPDCLLTDEIDSSDEENVRHYVKYKDFFVGSNDINRLISYETIRDVVATRFIKIYPYIEDHLQKTGRKGDLEAVLSIVEAFKGRMNADNASK